MIFLFDGFIWRFHLTVSFFGDKIWRFHFLAIKFDGFIWRFHFLAIKKKKKDDYIFVHVGNYVKKSTKKTSFFQKRPFRNNVTQSNIIFLWTSTLSKNVLCYFFFFRVYNLPPLLKNAVFEVLGVFLGVFSKKWW